ncbi:MAG: DUF2442 domain-containing protein [Planctomycetaceae bacterium]|nr:DUF2442 domain-containing protein [Planctomycetaceae bacterium]
MKKIVEVEAMENYRLRLTFQDGLVATVDLSDLVGKGVFELWNDYGQFREVSIGPSGELVWGQEVDLCADALYLRATGKQPEDIFPALKKDRAHA